MKLSLVIPLFNEAESLEELVRQCQDVLQKLDAKYEIIFIDDGSTDNSFETLKTLKKEESAIRIIRFRKNYGKSAALSVGFNKAQGDFIITMDSDLQDDPKEIPNLIAKLEGGYDLVSGWKKKRYDPINKRLPSKLFNRVTAKMTGIHIHDFNCGLKAYRKEVVKTIKVYGELHRFIPALAVWNGYRVDEIIVHHHPRKYGKTKFGMSRFFYGLLDFITVLFLTKYTRRPLHLFGVIGLILLAFGTIINTYLATLWFSGQGIGGRPLLLLGILLMILGVQSISMGLIGEMITSSNQDIKDYNIREEIE